MEKDNIVHNFDAPQTQKLGTKPVILFLIIIMLGIATGYILTMILGGTGGITGGVVNKLTTSKGQTFGSRDTKTFKDSAEGKLVEGGVDGEGQYHLERPGGPSQNVYLTSSVLDLSKFVGRKIKVWGETFKGEKAGWLMDVGRVQVLN